MRCVLTCAKGPPKQHETRLTVLEGRAAKPPNIGDWDHVLERAWKGLYGTVLQLAGGGRCKSSRLVATTGGEVS